MGVANAPAGMDPAFAAQFLKIQRAFVAGLPQRLRDIEQTHDAHARHVALHRLAGAAGGYGFSELSGMAREAMEAQQSGTEWLAQDALQRLAQAIADMPTLPAADGGGVAGSGR
jgi:HPt (histidine-containing phosphotransfer) domain-containing protein